ncbi:5-formyltetrahydrofolate cyclo-ligase [Rhodopseudomonas boonkerdii]|uniref:5-formyltetrahydrofolate cyclo-ligase n=1 Tax=Rhodopseudomonas boonkerdii TaxID=475937 RepID=UPI001E5052DF|nr:5-formyltetrahydrofolate cyclo-ligase [Rhodopseudomonas boonkerdii]UGV27926.1 5-formyltetrahydrofolate cyclo-ligase [Rhodopseudomonas boonkerdii]
MSLPIPTKPDLRTAALARRSALSEAYRDEAARALATHPFPLTVTPGAIVAGYSPIRSEIDPVRLMQSLAARGAELALPVVVARDEPLLFRAWDTANVLVAGSLGILEPSPDAPPVAPDILLVPLAAFDRAGHRIGYGAGHYDRTFAQLRAVKSFTAIGVAFDTQEIAAIPMQPHDVALDFVLTETRVIDFRSK